MEAENLMHVWTQDERRDQLADFETRCSRLAELYQSHRDADNASAFAWRAHEARRLIVGGFTQNDLKLLGQDFPAGPWWLNARAVDSGVTRQHWQQEVAEQHERASELALNLRSIATYQPPASATNAIASDPDGVPDRKR